MESLQRDQRRNTKKQVGKGVVSATIVGDANDTFTTVTLGFYDPLEGRRLTWREYGASVLGMLPFVSGYLIRHGDDVAAPLIDHSKELSEWSKTWLAKNDELLKAAGDIPKGNRHWLKRQAKVHDKRATAIFGEGKGRKLPGRRYDKQYGGRDIEFKGDNFRNPRGKEELDRMEKQIDKDAKFLKSKMANPHWHFLNDPRQATDMTDILTRLKKAGIPWTWGKQAPKFK